MKRYPSHNTRSQRGFSLAEVLTATAIFAIIFIAALMIYDRSNRVYKHGVEAADTQQSTRVAFDKLVADLRMTGFDYDRDGAPTSTLASTWQPSSPYSIGNLVEPDPPNGFVYRATTGGTSAATQPAWNTTAGSQTNEVAPSTVVWQLASEVQYQQPDEQIEYAGPAMVGIRANFDYELETGNCVNPGDPCQNGRETGYESDAFPLVTTGNDEIAIYALRPVNPPAGGLPQLSFFADMSKPRSVHIGAGSSEDQIDLPRNYDPCTDGCNNPPYTLYRITFEDQDGINFVETPVAENIRSMAVRYFRDAAATEEILPADLPLGAGPWDGSDPYATVDERDLRAEIRAIRINLVGMNPNPDGDYTDPNDAIAPQHRKYQLETLIVPRNIGRHGMKEFNTQIPGPPTLDVVCGGSCNAVYVSWTAAATGGDVESYNILYDTNPGSCNSGVPVNFTYAEDAGRNLEGHASLWITPGQTYYFAVQAISKYGNATSNCTSVMVTNTTKPSAPASISASGDGTVPEEANQITVSWPSVDTNQTPNTNVTCSNGTQRDTTRMPDAEKRAYRLFRSLDPSVVPGAPGTTEILNEYSPVQPSLVGTNLVFIDTPTANCQTYYYRVMTVDKCIANAAWNSGNNIDLAQSVYMPPIAADGWQGRAVDLLTPPAAPQAFTVTDSTCAAGVCDVEFAWSPVTKNDGDPTGIDIAINEYVIRAEQRAAVEPFDWVAAPLWPGNPNTAEASFTGGVLEGTVSGVAQGVEYRFFLRAKDCIDGVESTPAYYPCTFGGGAVSITAPISYGGTGAEADPWVVDTDASVLVETQNPVEQIQATVYQENVAIGTITVPGPTASANIVLPDLVDGIPALVAVTVTDSSAQACAMRYEYWVIDIAAPACALEDDQSDSNTVTWPGASDRQVDVLLKNESTDAMVIRRVRIVWTPGTGQRQANMLESIDFHTGTVMSGCQLGRTEVVAPTGTSVAGGASRLMTINFRRARAQAINTNPVSSICVEYQTPAGDVLRCSIAPTAGTCDTSTSDGTLTACQ